MDASLDTFILCVAPRKKPWVSLLNCSDLSTGESCDLTTYFNNAHCYYLARVQAFVPDQESNWTSSKLFYPMLDTILGAPVVELTGCGNCLLLQLSPPASRGHRRQLEFFFSDYVVNVSRTRDKAQFVIRASSGKNLINYLELGVEYCITVLPVTNLNNAVVPSGPHCTYTSPAPVNTVPVFVGALCTLFLLVALFSAALIYRGQLGVLHKLLPRTLSA
ncbi:interferon alpha/beta receptor 2-like [Colossoma macropomum]|uniref:interferon alpha/beta receptor 2-like n=1 Tax=Colossoma macropomum TaxID=42526 RepID=UPI001865337A|nr:interferon alpha/beta receptor 2-like [Colossoma macropomum]